MIIGEIKERQGLMGQHINHTNRTQENKSNGKYETVEDALNP
jgi:hypothetical protein